MIHVSKASTILAYFQSAKPRKLKSHLISPATMLVDRSTKDNYLKVQLTQAEKE